MVMDRLENLKGIIQYLMADLNISHQIPYTLEERKTMMRALMNVWVPKPIDAAFLILNPSQEEMYAKGFDYFMRKCNVKEVYPIHFKDDRKIISFLLQDPVSEPYRDKIRMTPDYTF